MVKILKVIFPAEEWDSKEFSRRNKKARQRELLVKLKEIFKNEEIIEDYRHEEIKRLSRSSLELDVFLPKLGLAFEFHGKQHYEEIPAAGFSSLDTQQMRDQEKSDLCKKHAIQLVVVPHWWDSQLESFMASILKGSKYYTTNI